MDLLNTILLINLPPQFQLVLITLVGIIGLHIILSTVFGFSTMISLFITALIVGGIISSIWYLSGKANPVPPKFNL